ncbi:MAG: hypothetical protein DMG92_11700 [Acidobacteria bacterium]|nr:MAG: hypothetical protein DMG92_11700 [Acidobacteriota bacterium]
MLLETVTAKEVPALDGVALVGFTVQVGGAPGPQLRATAFGYPFMAESVPLNWADKFTLATSDGLEIFRL